MLTATHQNPNELYNIFNSIDNIYHDINLMIEKDGIYLKQLNSTHICYVILELFSDDFSNFDYNYYENSIIIGINLKNLVSILNVCKDSNYIELILSDFDKLHIKSITNYDLKEFELNLLSIDNDMLHIPSFDYNCEFKLSSDIYSDIVDTCSIMKGDSIEFSILDKNLIIKSNGELGNYSQLFKSKTNMSENNKLIITKDNDCKKGRLITKKKETYMLNCSELNFNINFDLDILNKLKKISKMVDIIDISVKPDSPIKLDFIINDSTGSMLQFYISPKIRDD